MTRLDQTGPDRTGSVIKNKHRQTVCGALLLFSLPRLISALVFVLPVVGLSCAVVVVVVLTVDVVTPCAPSVEMFFNTQLGRLLLNTHLSRCSAAWVGSNRFHWAFDGICRKMSEIINL